MASLEPKLVSKTLFEQTFNSQGSQFNFREFVRKGPANALVSAVTSMGTVSQKNAALIKLYEYIWRLHKTKQSMSPHTYCKIDQTIYGVNIQFVLAKSIDIEKLDLQVKSEVMTQKRFAATVGYIFAKCAQPIMESKNIIHLEQLVAGVINPMADAFLEHPKLPNPLPKQSENPVEYLNAWRAFNMKVCLKMYHIVGFDFLVEEVGPALGVVLAFRFLYADKLGLTKDSPTEEVKTQRIFQTVGNKTYNGKSFVDFLTEQDIFNSHVTFIKETYPNVHKAERKLDRLNGELFRRFQDAANMVPTDHDVDNYMPPKSGSSSGNK